MIFVWAASLAGRLGVEGWSAWGVYVVTGTLQGALLVMGIRFEVRERRGRRKRGDADADGGGGGGEENGGVEDVGAGVETDDEGGHEVEGEGEGHESGDQSERTPLLGKGR
ncbi:MAG: hypothetical protein M1812_001968 [Candelaria pacifica]|nr:MAG: hypothetical protein M1812_001968 [Candelaria pacifica]